jgi:hypothetical protein
MGFESNSGCRQASQGDEGKRFQRKDTKGNHILDLSVWLEKSTVRNPLKETSYILS